MSEVQLERRAERNISRLTASTVALVLAGGKGSRLKALTEWRAKPSVPFGGKFRIIDFPLSNCINSGIRRISVITQYKSHSLQRHLQRGCSGFEYGFTFDDDVKENDTVVENYGVRTNFDWSCWLASGGVWTGGHCFLRCHPSDCVLPRVFFGDRKTR